MTATFPQIYLTIPAHPHDLNHLDLVPRLCDAVEIAAIRLTLDGAAAEDRLRICDLIRAITDPRDIALVATDDLALVTRAALDGVHLTEGLADIQPLRQDMGDGPIIGAFCGTSRHDGMLAGEHGADYVTFGPVGSDTQTIAQDEIFAWWSESIEIPVVAEGGLDEARIAGLSDKVDFLSLGDEVWQEADPVAALLRLAKARAG